MSIKNVFRKDIPIQVEPNGPQGPSVPSTGAREDEQLPDTISVGQPQSSDQSERPPEDANLWEESLAPVAPEPEPTQIDIPALRDFLFSLRDQNIYCPWCRCPDFGASPQTRTVHYLPECPLGQWCEKLLRHSPKDGYVVSWRK